MVRCRKKERPIPGAEELRHLREEQERNDEVMYRVMLGLSAAAVLAAAVLFLAPDLGSLFGDMPCALRQMTGLYCPGCGGTRAFFALLDGQVGKSLFYNPAVCYVLAFALIYMISHTLKHLSGGKMRGIRYRNVYCYLGVGLLAVNWGWKNYVLLVCHRMLIP